MEESEETKRMHDDLKLGARDKVVRKMTREGLVEQNLSRGSEEKISSRAADADFSRVHTEPEKEHGARDAPKNAGHKKRYFRGSGGEKAEGQARAETERDPAEGPVREKAESMTAEQKRKRRKALSQRSARSENVHEGKRSREFSSGKAGTADLPGKERTEAVVRKPKNLGGRFSSITGKAARETANEAGHLVEKSVDPQETEEKNVSEEAVRKASSVTEGSLRQVNVRRSRNRRKQSTGRESDLSGRSTGKKLRFETVGTEKTAGKTTGKTTGKKAKKEIQRRARNKRYAALFRSGRMTAAGAGTAGEAGASFLSKIKRSAVHLVRRHPGLIALLLAVLLLLVFMGSVLTTFGMAASSVGSSVVRSTYLASDEDIYAAEAAYSAMEAELQQKINSIERDYPGYEEYRYQVDEISHNPYQLISYLTVKFGDFDASSAEVQEELKALFAAQYDMDVDGGTKTITETKTVRVGEYLGAVVTSGYCNCPICCGKWSGGPTASGVYPTANHTIAVDASNPIVPMGTKVIMNGVEYTVEDTGNFAQYGVSFDVYYDDHAAASAHGWQTWDAYIADDNGTQTVEVTTARTVRALDVTVKNAGFDAVAKSRLDSDDAIEWYNILNASYGNRDYLWDPDVYAGYSPGGSDYTIPPEALSDERFRRMITEAEKYLGYPYVWGGDCPETSFDCSGFVSWVINNCGNGWSYGRLTAEELRGICAYVSPDQAKPGDLVFFQGTYDTSGASHVGIYVGDGMMIHCGDPIQYTSIETSYWQEHFLSFGRIP